MKSFIDNMSKSSFKPNTFLNKINVLDKGFVELTDLMLENPLLKIVNVARTSYNKESNWLTKKDYKLVKYLKEHEHYSCFRHSYFTFRIKIPLCIVRQMWKYQIGAEWNEISQDVTIPSTSWNEQSGRYTKFEPEFYIPEIVRKQDDKNKQSSYGNIDKIKSYFLGFDKEIYDYSLNKVDSQKVFEFYCAEQFMRYEKMIEEGVCKEQARMILPQNIYTTCMVTMSLQTIMFFLHQRLKKDSQYEIQQYAQKILELLKPVFEPFDFKQWIREYNGKKDKSKRFIGWIIKKDGFDIDNTFLPKKSFNMVEKEVLCLKPKLKAVFQ